MDTETFAEERTRLVREESLKRCEDYRKANNIGKYDIYYHPWENMWRPDSIQATIPLGAH